MELTRRDAAAALAAIGATGGVALGVRRTTDDGGAEEEAPAWDGDGTPGDEAVRTAMTAVARTVYPDAVSGVEAFVEAFLDGRLDGSAHGEGIRSAVAEVESAARSWYGAPVAELSAADRDALLRELGADVAEENPDGTAAERVRYYVVNELLLALYSSPTGGELVGIENPQGYAGGAESYQRGPP
ncbi:MULTISPECIES: gluconate 2-dehydrogenase subunit 3 family protein [unclassified Halorubrum]|uniref:gluconate 2-dehydrogenase subunit 3 family protein n=1 Tax=unclassified Halorubrum TaxID=2642239 RepID=UPI0010F4A01D|nr:MULTISPECIES: gluconate 2-dehydrogenase subunit 3 family protein [unclassified Halorubrum]TKX43195.1 gluconate 2-dehydrogenase subunit 3 family protein [Halorubrum sp. ARQ200]TKX49690.1 gluconate 2-dehydrogenase subunit 3 family protein [Halorubrum sp. ASP121]